MNHPNVQKVLDYLSAVGKQDFVTAASFFTDNVEYRVSGNNQFSGVFYGAAAIMDYFGKMMQLSGGTYKVTGFSDWLVSDSKVLAIANEEVTINSETFQWTRLLLFEFDEAKKMKRISFYDEEQDKLDKIIGMQP